MPTRCLTCLVTFLFLSTLTAGHAVATCAISRSISSATQSGVSYIGSLDVCPGFQYPCPGGGSSVTNDARGFFWLIGEGDAAIGSGIDNGTLPALDGATNGFLYAYPGYAAFIVSDWADNRTDGCPDASLPIRCTAMVVTDQLNGVGYSAILTASEGSFGSYDFVRFASIRRRSP